ncbi:putative Heat shock protein 70 family [Helianthus annuus]|nr:putative Heat shock protein 70 family [Helianthus annuus]
MSNLPSSHSDDSPIGWGVTVDIGHASMQVCIAGFKKDQSKILAHSFDRCLGGRDFDEVSFQHFAKKFKTEYKIDVFTNTRACLGLRAACEKLKKVLSANPEAPMNIECLLDDKYVRGFIKRDEFEQISTSILEHVKKPLEKALTEAQLTVDNIYAVEPRCTMNASECVSIGCALECAFFSPTFKVREFQNGNAENQQSSIVFPKGNQIPSVKALTFYRTGMFTVDLQHADVSELQAPPKISTYTIGPFQATQGDRAKVKVKARLNLHGVVSVESAQLIEEEEVEVPVSKEPSKRDVDKAPADDAPVTENDAQEAGDNPVQMEADTKVEAPKKKVKKVNIPVSDLVYGAMLAADVEKAIEKEFEMAL